MENSADVVFRIDPLTRLPNRRQFSADYRRAEGADAVMLTLADAAHFNRLLRAAGHECSEAFICEGAAVLRAALPAEIAIYHVSVMSFVFVIEGGADSALLDRIAGQFKKPLHCGGIPVITDVALGLTSCTEDAAVVLRTALAAAQDSRARRIAWSRYDAASDGVHQRGFLLLSHLSVAIESPDQLALVYQPIFQLSAGGAPAGAVPIGVEALLRWNHPEFGPISPGEFVPLAEATALIEALTVWVLRASIAQAAAWAAAGQHLNIAINVSPHNLARPGFAAQIAELLAQNSVDPARIELEFTEGVLMHQDRIVSRELQVLRATGIRVAIDDFGTGFANFGYVKDLPVDIIKLDKSLIRGIDADERAASVVRALIGLAHGLRYSVCAEGIETREELDRLAAWGCDEGQGFYLGRPLPPDRLAALF